MDNKTIKIRFVRTHLDAQLPAANNISLLTGDTGYDLYCIEGAYIPRGGSRTIAVGLTVAYIEPGYWLQIMPRSGLGFKKGLQPHLGVIDNQYRGDLAVKLYNFSDNPASIKKGDRIAQLVIHKLNQGNFELVDDISSTDRGDRGFGSSGR